MHFKRQSLVLMLLVGVSDRKLSLLLVFVMLGVFVRAAVASELGVLVCKIQEGNRDHILSPSLGYHYFPFCNLIASLGVNSELSPSWDFYSFLVLNSHSDLVYYSF